MNFEISTDLTTKNTFVSIDGKKLNDDMNVAAITFYADAPNTEYYSDSEGYVSCSVTSYDSDGNFNRTNYSNNTKRAEATKPLGLQDEASFKMSDFTSYLGDVVETKDADPKVELIDSIIAFCDEKKIKVSTKEQLLTRTISSLEDKKTDLGI